MSIYHFSNTPHGTMKTGEKINTLTHYNYICRAGRYNHMKDHREDLAYTANGNIPNDNPKKFWKTAEKYRRKNGRAYREIRLGLQEELSLEDNIEIVEEFLAKSGIKDKHAYSYAIHDKQAAFDKGHRNIHVHIMFNEREIEHDRPLGLDEYFKRYSVNKNKEPIGGYKMSKYFKSKVSTIEMRQLWEDIVNQKFKERNIPIQVSAKRLVKQREILLKEGKYEEAELLNRIPAPHLGERFKNPTIMKYIWQRIESIETQHKYPNAIQSEVFTDNMDKKEQAIELFAYDYVLRKAAREIQQRRIHINEAIHNSQSFNEDIKQPYLITVNDMRGFIQGRLQQPIDDKERDILLSAYQSLAKQKGMEVIVKHEIPLTITREDRINGKDSLKTFPMFASNGNIYIRIAKGKGIRLGDPLENGEAIVYDTKPKQPVATDERIALYKKTTENELLEALNELTASLQKEHEVKKEKSRIAKREMTDGKTGMGQ